MLRRCFRFFASVVALMAFGAINATEAPNRVPAQCPAPYCKPNLIMFSVGVNYVAVNSNREDVFAQEARHIEDGIKKACDSSYHVKIKSVHSQQATREKCLEGLKWVADVAGPDDLCIVYIGTHGSGGKEGNFKFYPASDSVTAAEIIEALSKVKAHLLLLVDACHAGAMLVDWDKHNDRVAILAACESHKSAYVWNFVKPFVKALSEADYDNNRSVDIGEVETYVQKHCDSSQKPVASPNGRQRMLCHLDKCFNLK